MLAGGAGRRLGGVDKPGLVLAGRSLLDRAVAAVGDVPTVVVGPVRDTGRPVVHVAEDPPGSGPAAALHAGLLALPTLSPGAIIAVHPADHPALSAATIGRRGAALAAAPEADGAVLVDVDGREQLLLGVWRLDALTGAAARRTSWAGQSVRSLLAPLRRLAVAAVGDEAADVDTPEQWRRWSPS